MTILTKLLTPDARPEPSKRTGSNAYQAVAEAVGTLRQYQDVPYRFQKQWITSFLAIMVLISIVSGLYLNVASRTAITGREIQSMQRSITENKRSNADLQTQIAMLLSNESLQKRAEDAGFVPLKVENLDYLVVPGFVSQKGVNMDSPAPVNEDIRMSPEFSESLFSWLATQIEAASKPLAQEQ